MKVVVRKEHRVSWCAVSSENALGAFSLVRCPRRTVHGNMKERIILVAMLMVTGCGKLEDAAPAKPERPDNFHQAEGATAQSRRSETNDAGDAYARGVVTLKTGRRVVGKILLQCPGYLTVCFKSGPSKPGDSELISYEEVRSVMLEEALSDVDPGWMELRKEMTIIDPGPKAQ